MRKMEFNCVQVLEIKEVDHFTMKPMSTLV